MSSIDADTNPSSRRVMIWIGRIITLLLSMLFGMSALMKFRGGPEFNEAMAHLGLPVSMVLPLAILELVCVATYLFPPTQVVGAILLTGYLGGAICTHWRVGDAFLLNIGLGLLVWLAVYLRDPRLRSLIPITSARREAM